MQTDGLRLALVSTPRAGNTWLRHMLAQSLDLQSLSAHRPDDVDWDSIHSRSILQMHWEPDEAFRAKLEQHAFRVIVLARHPLDVLISTLSFSQHDDSTLRWLDGRGGDERCLEGASPTSETFLGYAIGPRARAILDVSAQWWDWPDVCRVRYEDLVGDPAGQMSDILANLGTSAVRPVAEVAAKANPESMRNLSVGMQFHVWQATPGVWRRLLTASAARQICDAHADVLRRLCYACDADETLDETRAEQAWERMNAAALRRTIRGVKQAVIALERQRPELERMRADLQQQVIALHEQRSTVESLVRQLTEIGPWSLGAARALHQSSLRFPRVASAIKSTVVFSRRTLHALTSRRSSALPEHQLRVVGADDLAEREEPALLPAVMLDGSRDRSQRAA